jgi:hypothetical protein
MIYRRNLYNLLVPWIYVPSGIHRWIPASAGMTSGISFLKPEFGKEGHKKSRSS